MKREFIIGALLLCCAAGYAIKPKPLVYNGDTLQQSNIFRRSKIGVVSTGLDIQEVSGIACSRVTPGYIWMQSDNEDKINGKYDNDHIIATDPSGAKLYTRVNFLNLDNAGIRFWDWEDMSGGVYDGKNYLFIGAFGDNDEVESHYSIVYFEEPAITEGKTISITPSQIRYVYPDGKSHNCEALMYDNVEQMLYIITKVYYNVCQVFSLPFRLDYGKEKQTLTYVCDLGVKSDLGPAEATNPWRGFHLVTGADISPDGKYILIKNHNNIEAIYSWVLYWEREGDESVAETVKRQPVVLDCYQSEWQGEAICWLDDNIFYTTSDSDGEPPIYKYTRRQNTAVDDARIDAQPATLQLIDNKLFVRTNSGLYAIDGQKVK